jgi:MoxR-like ATPase
MRELNPPTLANGSYRRTRGGIFIPERNVLLDTLKKTIVPPDKKLNYIPYGDELNSLEIAQKTGQAVLFAGPTGVGKSMLALKYAQNTGLPFLYSTCDPDKTQGQLMGKPNLLFSVVELDGKPFVISNQVFMPSNISIAGLAGEKVIIFIDELHKLRKDVDVLFHPLLQERIVNLSDHLGPGEIYNLHPESLIIFSLNPYYGDSGIEKVGPAMRQRVKTLYFPMITDENKIFEIVKANVDGYENLAKDKQETFKRIVLMSMAIARIYLEYKKQGTTNQDDLTLKNELKNSLPLINEAPSPRLLVNVAKCIVAGQNPRDALIEGLFNAITNDFGLTTNGFLTQAMSWYNIR